jgi:hypothetical protein
MSFRRPDDAEKWCEIQCTVGHDLEECKTFMDQKKMPPPLATMSQEPQRGDHRREDSDGDDQMGEINVIFRGSMCLASKTQWKKL